MKRWFSMMLLVGALLGLFAQEAAFASGPFTPVVQEVSVNASMDADCMEAMGSSQNPSEMPCKGLTLDCIAKMGCAVPLAPAPSGYTTMSPPPAHSDLAAAPVKPMIGRITGPEPHPPSRLG